jgi:hypothetical protein
MDTNYRRRGASRVINGQEGGTMLLEPISAGLIVLLFLMGNKHSIKMVVLRIAVFIVATAICGYQLFRLMPVGNAQVMVITGTLLAILIVPIVLINREIKIRQRLNK